MEAEQVDAKTNKTLRSGNKIPIIGLGTWKLTRDPVDTIIQAFQWGYRLIDTSGDYGTQAAVGNAIKNSGADRQNLFIVTKVEEYEDSYAATKQNLAELGLDYVDLMLIHRPPKHSSGEDLWDGLLRAKNEGLARDIGVSNYSSVQIKDLIESSGEVPAVNQIEWSPFGYSQEMIDFAEDNDIVIMAYSPLTRAERLEDDTLEEISDHYNKTPAQILLRWSIQSGAIPIPKANDLDHLQENIDIFDFDISEEDMDLLYDLNEAYSALGTLPY